MLDVRPDPLRALPARATVSGFTFTAGYRPGAVADRARTRAERTARARAVAAADDERRRVVRDLHDGAQQRLVHTMLVLELALRSLELDRDEARALIRAGLEHAKSANAELRALARGVVPLDLRLGGLEAGVRALAEQSPVAVEVDVAVGRLAPVVEATAYFVIAEALTNIAKHARASAAAVAASLDGDVLRVDIRDDGAGGADPHGCGLRGLAERVAALDGDLEVVSPPANGTWIAAVIPLVA